MVADSSQPHKLTWLDYFWRPFFDPLSCLTPPAEVPENRTAAELLRQLRLSLHQRLKEVRSGVRRSVLRGQGDDFAELREYSPGDDIRKMDWNVLARTTVPHIREYYADRQRTWWFVLDCTASMRFGQQRSKLDHVITMAGYLGLMAQQEGCRVGAVLIGDSATTSSLKVIPPAQGEANLQRILTEALRLNQSSIPVGHSASDEARSQTANSDSPKADPLRTACERLSALIARSATVFFVSDFLEWPPHAQRPSDSITDSNPLPAWKKQLGQLARKTDVITIPVWDSIELKLPDALGCVPVIDPETGDVCVLDTHSTEFRSQYENVAIAQHEALLGWLRSIGQVIPAPTSTDLLDCLLGRTPSNTLSTTLGGVLP